MFKEDLKGTKKRPNKKPKAKTMIVKGTVTFEQRELLQKFIGIIGSNEQDVVGKIITLWLYTEGYLKGKRIPKTKR